MRVHSTREAFRKSGVTDVTGVTEIRLYLFLVLLIHTFIVRAAKVRKITIGFENLAESG